MTIAVEIGLKKISDYISWPSRTILNSSAGPFSVKATELSFSCSCAAVADGFAWARLGMSDPTIRSEAAIANLFKVEFD